MNKINYWLSLLVGSQINLNELDICFLFFIVVVWGWYEADFVLFLFWGLKVYQLAVPDTVLSEISDDPLCCDGLSMCEATSSLLTKSEMPMRLFQAKNLSPFHFSRHHRRFLSMLMIHKHFLRLHLSLRGACIELLYRSSERRHYQARGRRKENKKQHFAL